MLGLFPATAILTAAGDESLEAVAVGEVRPVYVPARPPGDEVGGWTVDAASGLERPSAPKAEVDGDSVTLTGAAAFVPDAPGADLLVAIGVTGDGTPVAAAISADASGVSVEGVMRYDATRSLGHITFEGAQGRKLDVGEEVLEDAWYLTQALIGSESLGAVQSCLEVAVEYAKERFTFGRAIGSYQAIKHDLTEVLRLQENARALQYYAGWARDDKPDEFALAASAARTAAGHALDYAARTQINVHGGIGATWEHDAPLFFRRAQLARRLVGGSHDAVDRVAEQMFEGALA
jgi:alkylation response protein AidB-like acyl-CoA dehydrogenase